MHKHKKCDTLSSHDPEQAVATYLKGPGDLVNGSIRGIIRVTIWVIGVINLLTKSP